MFGKVEIVSQETLSHTVTTTIRKSIKFSNGFVVEYKIINDDLINVCFKKDKVYYNSYISKEKIENVLNQPWYKFREFDNSLESVIKTEEDILNFNQWGNLYYNAETTIVDINGNYIPFAISFKGIYLPCHLGLKRDENSLILLGEYIRSLSEEVLIDFSIERVPYYNADPDLSYIEHKFDEGLIKVSSELFQKFLRKSTLERFDKVYDSDLLFQYFIEKFLIEHPECKE